jgi:DNA-binding LytR/AlgR family response regulator
MSKIIFMRINGKIVPVNVSVIKLIESDRDYVKINMVDGSKLLKRCTMDDIENKLACDFLCRVDRCFIVNVHYIKEIDRGVIIMEDINIPLHKKYATIFIKRYMPLDASVAA